MTTTITGPIGITIPASGKSARKMFFFETGPVFEASTESEAASHALQPISIQAMSEPPTPPSRPQPTPKSRVPLRCTPLTGLVSIDSLPGRLNWSNAGTVPGSGLRRPEALWGTIVTPGASFGVPRNWSGPNARSTQNSPWTRASCRVAVQR